MFSERRRDYALDNARIRRDSALLRNQLVCMCPTVSTRGMSSCVYHPTIWLGPGKMRVPHVSGLKRGRWQRKLPPRHRYIHSEAFRPAQPAVGSAVMHRKRGAHGGRTCSRVMRHRAQRIMTCSRLFRPHENLSNEVNRELVQSEIEGGVRRIIPLAREIIFPLTLNPVVTNVNL